MAHHTVYLFAWRLRGIQGQFSAMGTEKGILLEPPKTQPALEGSVEHADSVNHTAEKTDRRRFGDIPRRAGDLPNPVSEADRLHQHLVVEETVVRVFQEGKGGQYLPAETPESGVVLGQLVPHQNVLEER